jgi:NADPH-dependent ferric siderophore reductase
MTSPQQPSEAPRRRGRVPRTVAVARVQVLSPAMRRVTLRGDALAGFPEFQPAAYIKLVFPEAGSDKPPRMLPDSPRPTTMRTYTPRAFRPDALEMDVDFVLHGHGIAAVWAAQAREGQELVLMGPGPGYLPDAQATDFLLAGDASALPALEMVATALPSGARRRLLVEVPNLAEMRALPGLADDEVQWLERGADSRLAGRALEAALRAAPPMGAGTRAYVACEAGAMRRIKAWLLGEAGMDRQRVVGRGYWQLGEANHPDHDYGEDVTPP